MLFPVQETYEAFLSVQFEGKSKGKWSITVRKTPHRYGNSRAIWDHTVLPAATRQQGRINR